MAKKPAAKTPAKSTRTTQDESKALAKAIGTTQAENVPKEPPATDAVSTDQGPASASEPAFPDLHAVTDTEHHVLHRLRATALAEGSATARRKVLKAIDTDQSHPIVQKYKDALLEWLAS